MAQRHQRKRAASRSSVNLSRSPSLVAAFVALLSASLRSHGLAERGDDSSWNFANAKLIPYRRRVRVAGPVRRGDDSSVANRNNDRVNLLVKYKDGHARSRSLSNAANSNDSTLDTWEAHAVSISTISEASTTCFDCLCSLHVILYLSLCTLMSVHNYSLWPFFNY